MVNKPVSELPVASSLTDSFMFAVQGGINVRVPGGLAQAASNELSQIANIVPAESDLIQNVGGIWTNASIADVKASLNFDAADVGLDQVDNTSDADKPVSDATQTALDGKLAKASNLQDVTDEAQARYNIQTPTYVASRTELKALDPDKDKAANFDGSEWVWTLGDYTSAIASDPYEGIYAKADSVAASTGAWVRPITSKQIFATWFGAVGDLGTDSAPQIISAKTIALAGEYELVFGAGPYRLDQTVDLRRVRVSAAYARFVGYFDGYVLVGSDLVAVPVIIAGGRSGVALGPTQTFDRVQRFTGYVAGPILQIRGAVYQTVTCNLCDYVQLYASTDPALSGYDEYNAYSTFFYGYWAKLELTTDDNTVHGGNYVQWNNQNHFYGGKIGELIFSGSYDHNHNVFHGGTFEGGASIDFQKGKSNWFPDCRFENDCFVWFQEGTILNSLVNTWADTTTDMMGQGVGATIITGKLNFDTQTVNFGASTTLTGGTSGATATIRRIIDNGTSGTIWMTGVTGTFVDNETITGNVAGSALADGVVLTSNASQLNVMVPAWTAMFRGSTTLARLTRNDWCFDTQTRFGDRTPALGRVVGSSAGLIGDTELDLIKVLPGGVVVFRRDATATLIAADTARFNVRTYCYDENQKLIVPVITTDYVSSSLSTISSSYIGAASSISSGSFMIAENSAIKYIRIDFRAPTTAAHNNCDQIEAIYQQFAAARVNIQQYDVGHRIRHNRPGDHPVSGVPTQGFATQGYACQDISGAIHTCTFSMDTTVGSAYVSGTTLVLATGGGTGSANSDIVGVLNDNNRITDWRTISSGGGTDTLVLSSGLTGACALGNRVVIVRWATRA